MKKIYYVVFFCIAFCVSLILNSSVVIFVASFCLLTLLIKDKLKSFKTKRIKNVQNLNFSKIKSIKDVDDLSYREFEYFVSYILTKQGYKCVVTKSSYDFGVDVMCVKNGKLICVQTKKYVNTVGIKSVQEVYSGTKYYKADEGWVITTAPNFSRQAIRLAKSLNVKLIDRQQLEQILKNVNFYK